MPGPSFNDNAAPQQLMMENNGSGDPIYIGLAGPGTPTSEPGWQIRKFVYVGGNVTSITYADGKDSFTKVWDSRASYAY